jgi:hypothetical protein
MRYNCLMTSNERLGIRRHASSHQPWPEMEEPTMADVADPSNAPHSRRPLRDIRRKPRGGFAGPVGPDALVGTFADRPRRRSPGHWQLRHGQPQRRARPTARGLLRRRRAHIGIVTHDAGERSRVSGRLPTREGHARRAGRGCRAREMAAEGADPTLGNDPAASPGLSAPRPVKLRALHRRRRHLRELSEDRLVELGKVGIALVEQLDQAKVTSVERG